MLDLRNFEVLTFDCYGTLIDWETGIMSVLRAMREENRLAATDAQLMTAYTRAEAHVQRSYYRPYKDVLRSVMKAVALHFGVPVGKFDENALVKSLPNWKPFPDTNEALATLSQYYRLCILSNIDDDLFEETAVRLDTTFDRVITAQQIGAYKPAFKMFRSARDILGVHQSRILHVAQSLFHDIKPAHSLDWHAVWVNRVKQVRGYGATQAGEAEADLTVRDLATLADLVREQLGDPKPRPEQAHFYI